MALQSKDLTCRETTDDFHGEFFPYCMDEMPFRVHSSTQADGVLRLRQKKETILSYKPFTALRSVPFRICSANSLRLIFIEAVRGKSLSQTRYPPTRLKSGKRRLRSATSSSNELVT